MGDSGSEAQKSAFQQTVQVIRMFLKLRTTALVPAVVCGKGHQQITERVKKALCFLML